MHIGSLSLGNLRLRRWLLNPYVLLVLAAVSVWLLDGFNIGPLNDGWIDLGLKVNHGHLLRHGATTRIFGSLPRAIGVAVVDDGFQGWQTMLLLLSCLRAILFFDIVRRLLPRERLFAFACGLLALFHPADYSWFWVDATGAHLGFVLALAACWASLAYLQGGALTWLLATWVLQFVACFTYTAYLPLMFAFPLGVWLLLMLRDAAPSKWRLLGVTSLVFLCAILQVVLLSHGVGRESRVADFHLNAVFAGYGSELWLFVVASVHTFAGFKPVYLLYAAVPALLTWFCVSEPRTPDAAERPVRPLFHAAMLLGLVALAAASYFPYALSDVRFGNKRQLLAAGIFLYTAFAYLVFVLLPTRLETWPRLRRWLFPGLLVLLTVLTVVIGLERRTVFVDMYRAEENLLAEVAALVPQPEAGATVLVRLHNSAQAKQIPGFYNRPAALESALQVMYSDTRLHADFMPQDLAQLKFMPDGLVLRRRPDRDAGGRHKRRRRLGQDAGGRHNRALQDVHVPYSQLIMVDYPPDGRAVILDRSWLQQAAGKLDVSTYRPAEITGQWPGPEAITCTMLEPKFRPKYCP